MSNPSFAELYPEIAKQWHPSLNGDLKPNDVTPGSGQIVYWVCPKNSDHVWKTRVNARVKGRGCPYCANKRTLGKEYKTLAVAFPEIAQEWHPTKNGNRSPETIGEASSIKVWWKCSTNPEHEWTTSPYERTAHGVSCPYCSGRQINRENSFGGKYPELVKQWHLTKNGALSPYELFPYSKEKVWWICQDDPTHEWQAQIKTRIETSGNCPICARKVSKKLPLLSIYSPELVKEWHPTKNGDLTPNQFSAGSTKKVWWQCNNNPSHEWEAVIGNRTTKGKGCPYCKGTKAGENSFAKLYPQIAAEWHPTKNELSANDVTPGSKRKVWWQCANNPEHEWESFVFNRARGDGNCPICAQVGKSFAEKYPEIAKEWHPTRNEGVIPKDVAHSSQKKYWWLCSANPEHEWEATVQNRGVNGSGCPYCHREKQSQELRDYLVSSATANTEYFQTFVEGIRNIHRLLKLEPPLDEQKQILYRLLYANAVTLMETFLSDAITHIVLTDQTLKRKLIETTPKFAEAKLAKSDVFSWFERIDKEVADYLQNDITFHNIWIAEKLYKNVLGIRFPQDLTSLNKIIMTRHDIVHRNGKTVAGKPVNLSVDDVKNTIKVISDFVSHVEKQLSARN
jgi:hypothetical protein